MLVNGKSFQSIWFDDNEQRVYIIDQRKLPFSFEQVELKTITDSYQAIVDMAVRGAPLIGVTAAFGLYLAIKNNMDVQQIDILNYAKYLKSTRPTAVNLEKVIDSMCLQLAKATNRTMLLSQALIFAKNTATYEIDHCSRIGDEGLAILEKLYYKTNRTINILTHCNAGWLACVDWGTALAPIYKAHSKGMPVHVWVDETRPRNQGARLTAWELKSAGIPYTVIPDNTGGHLMQQGMVDLVLVGSDRTTRNGDVANKIGTYLKALAAADNGIPFYVALPSSSIDFTMVDGLKNIPIEQRSAAEVTQMEGLFEHNLCVVNILPPNTPVANYGFDVTPARLITGLITERGTCTATEASLMQLFPEYR